jgi:hypothetical protein
VQPSEAEVVDALQRHLDGGEDRRQAVARVASNLGLAKREVYRLAVGLDPSGGRGGR